MTMLESLRIDTRQLMAGVINRVTPRRRRQPALIEHVRPKTVMLLRHFPGVDIDEYRARRGKEEGEAQFFFDNKESERIIKSDNLFMFNGACLLWQYALGNGNATANEPFSSGPTLLNNSNTYLWVSDGGPTVITGTASVTNGSATVTTSSGSPGITSGSSFIVSGDSSSQVYTITGSGSLWTISPVYGGSTNTTATAYTIPALTHSQTLMAGSSSSNIADQVADATFPSNPYAAQFNAITGATNATPIVLTVSSADVNANDIVHVVEVPGNTGANGAFVANPASASSITLLGSVGNGAYTSGGYITKRSVFTMQSTFGAVAAVFQWNSWAIYNGSGSNKIIMNNRVTGLGSKASGTSSALKVGVAIG